MDAGSKRTFSKISEDASAPSWKEEFDSECVLDEQERLGEAEADAKAVATPASDSHKSGSDPAGTSLVVANGPNSQESYRIQQILGSSGPAQGTVSAVWWHRFVDSARTVQMSPLVRAIGGGHGLSQENLDLLNEWYGTSDDVSLSFIVVGSGEGPSTLQADGSTTVTQALSEYDISEDAILWAGPLRGYNLGVTSAELSKVARDQLLRPVLADASLDSLSLGVADVIIVEPSSQFPVGRVGLNNLGNTCFMNSALQCLVHVPELVAYFVSNSHIADINRDNPIGCGGAVAESFAALLIQLYGDHFHALDAVSPASFRRTIGRFNRAFASYVQQDSQEFTAFLLDSLHEDLNRIRQKPATTKPELPKGTPTTDSDAIRRLAEECWETHLLRNDSVIQSVFMGMYKSTVVCPVCSSVSITYDPFFDLTLPLPGGSGKWAHSVLIVPLSGPLKQTEVALDPHASISDLKRQVSELLGLSNSLTVCDVYNARFYRVLEDKEPVAAKVGQDDVLVVYERHEGSVPVYLRQNGTFAGMPFYVDDSDRIETLRANVIRRFNDLHEANESIGAPTLAVIEGDATRYSRYLPSKERSLEAEVTEDSDSDISALSVPTDIPEDMQADTPADTPADTSAATPSFEAPIAEDVISSPVMKQRVEPELDAECETIEYLEPKHQAASPFPDAGETSSFAEEGIASTGPLPSSGLVGGDTLLADFGGSWDIRVAETVVNPADVEARTLLDKNHSTTLDDCLNQFARPEVLGEHDEWYCPNCREFRRARKQLELWRVPDVFMIHLKRFSDFAAIRDKITDLVNFPITDWNVAKHVCPDSPSSSSPELVYDLIAVDNHFGGLGGGHYTAHVQNIVGDNSWYYFDDSRVTPIADSEDTETPAAYLLFYRRRSAQAEEATLAARRAILNLRAKNLAEERAPPPPPSPPPAPASTVQTNWGTGNVLGTGSPGGAQLLPWSLPENSSVDAELDSTDDNAEVMDGLGPLTGLPSYADAVESTAEDIADSAKE